LVFADLVFADLIEGDLIEDDFADADLELDLGFALVFAAVAKVAESS
jgi:hypothetical protein